MTGGLRRRGRVGRARGCDGRRADERSEGGGIARLQFDRKPRRGRAVDDRSGGNAGRTGRARKIDDDPGFAGRKQAETEVLHHRIVAQRADLADRRVEAEADLRHVDDNAIGRGQGGRAGVNRSRKVEHELGPSLILREPRARPRLARPLRPRTARSSGAAVNVKATRAAKRPNRAIQPPLGAARHRAIGPTPPPRNRSAFSWARAAGRMNPTARAKMSAEALYDELTGSRHADLRTRRQDARRSAPSRSTNRKRTCQGARRRLFKARYEFGLRPRGRLARWLSEAFAGTVMRRPAACADNVGAGCRPVGWLATAIRRRGSAQEDCEQKATNRPAGKRLAARPGS